MIIDFINEGINEQLEGKQDLLVSGENIKTINGNSILGSGNLVIEGGGTGSTVTVDTEMSDSSENPVQNKVIKAYVDSSITAATEDLASEAYVDSAISGATSNFVTSGDVETQITSKGYATEGYVDGAISSATADFVTSGDVETQITSKNYATTGDVESAVSGLASENYVDSAITAATQNFVTSGDVETQITSKNYATTGYVDNAVSGLASENYVDSAVTAATQNFVTSGDVATQVSDFTYSKAVIDEKVAGGGTFDPTQYYTKTEVDNEISAATQDLASEAYVTAATADFVTSGDVETQITSKNYATTGYVDSAVSGLASENYVDAAVTAATADMATTGDVASAVSGLASEAYVTNAITAATDDMATQTWVNQQGFATPSDIEGKLDTSAFTAYTTSTDAHIADVEEVTSRALNDLNTNKVSSGYVDSAITAATADFVTSGDVETQITGKGYATTTYVDNGLADKADKSKESTVPITELETTSDVWETNKLGAFHLTNIEGVLVNETSANSNVFYRSGVGYISSEGDDVTLEIGQSTTLVEGSGIIRADAAGYYILDTRGSSPVLTLASGLTATVSYDVVYEDDLAGYATEAYVTAATQNFVTSGDVETQITAATTNLASKSYVDSEIVTKADKTITISTPTGGTTVNFTPNSTTNPYTFFTDNGGSRIDTYDTDVAYIKVTSLNNFSGSSIVLSYASKYWVPSSEYTGPGAYEIVEVPSAEYKWGNITGNYYVVFDAHNDLISIQEGNTSLYVPDGYTDTSYDVVYENDLSGYTTSSEVNAAITAATSTKQDTLVSGTNIKTINGNSLLGSGNIVIQGGGGTGGTEYYAGTNIEIDGNNYINVTGITSQVNTYWVDGGDSEYVESGTGYDFYSSYVERNGDTVMSENPNVTFFQYRIYGQSTNQSYYLKQHGVDQWYGITNTGSCIELDTVYDIVDAGTDSSSLTNPIVVSGFTDYFDIYYFFDMENMKFWASRTFKYSVTGPQSLVYGTMPVAQDGSAKKEYVYDAGNGSEYKRVVSKTQIDVQQYEGKLRITPTVSFWGDENGGMSFDTKNVPTATASADGAMPKADKSRMDEINSELAIPSAYTIGSTTSGESTSYLFEINGTPTYFNHTDVNGIYVASYTATSGDSVWFSVYKEESGSRQMYHWNEVLITDGNSFPIERSLENQWQNSYVSFGEFSGQMYLIWDTNNDVMLFKTDLGYVSGYKNVVGSSDVYNIVKMSQSDYDNLQTKDNNTLYIII